MEPLNLTDSKDLALVLSIEYLSGLFVSGLKRKELRKKAEAKRKLCIDHYIKNGHHEALYEFKSPNGESVRWTEIVDDDTFDLYGW